MTNLINWFEIPVRDMERAKRFYQNILNTPISVDEQLAPGFKMGIISHYGQNNLGVSGALVEGQGYDPSQGNTLIYFNANEIGGVDQFLERVQKAGGEVTGPKMLVTDEIGYCGFFTDCEGNRMAVHARF